MRTSTRNKLGFTSLFSSFPHFFSSSSHSLKYVYMHVKLAFLLFKPLFTLNVIPFQYESKVFGFILTKACVKIGYFELLRVSKSHKCIEKPELY